MSETVLHFCRQCGTCCKKSSPTLHPGDSGLITGGKIPIKDLFTIRKGEPVHDTISDRPGFALDEMIKIREHPEQRGCIFLTKPGNACSIYHSRPLQCRILECWNTGPLKDLARTARLRRSDIISDPELYSLITTHEKKLSVEKFLALLSDGNNKTGEISEMIAYDLHFREFLTDNGIIPEGGGDFYLGRPLLVIVLSMGYRLEGDDERGYILSGGKDD